MQELIVDFFSNYYVRIPILTLGGLHLGYLMGRIITEPIRNYIIGEWDATQAH